MNLPAILKGSPLAKGNRPEFVLIEAENELARWRLLPCLSEWNTLVPELGCITDYNDESRIASTTYTARSERIVERWRERLAGFPSPDRVAAMVACVNAALAVRTEKGIRTQVGLLVGSYPSARPPDPAIYVDAMIYEVLAGDYGDAVVALACQQVRRTIKFLPAVAEVIAAADAIAARWERLPAICTTIEDRRADYRRFIERGEAEIKRIEKLKAERLAP
jgi:hypothetical protein